MFTVHISFHFSNYIILNLFNGILDKLLYSIMYFMLITKIFGYKIKFGSIYQLINLAEYKQNRFTIEAYYMLLCIIFISIASFIIKIGR